MVLLELGCFFFGVSVGLSAPAIYDNLFNKPIILRDIPKEEAKELIAEYVKNNEGIYTSDVVFNLRLSVDLVLDCLNELSDEGIIEAKDYDSLRPSVKDSSELNVGESDNE